MKLLHQVQEVSRVGEHVRLTKKGARDVLLVVAEWLETEGIGERDVIRALRAEAAK